MLVALFFNEVDSHWVIPIPISILKPFTGYRGVEMFDLNLVFRNLVYSAET